MPAIANFHQGEMRRRRIGASKSLTGYWGTALHVGPRATLCPLTCHVASRVKGGIVLAFSEKTALRSESCRGAYGIARKPAGPLSTLFGYAERQQAS
jgi:hypothetical protein